jgi:hypothetical protein
MDFLKDRRVIVVAGMGLALTAGLALAAFLLSRDPRATEPPPASQGGLVVETGRDDDIKLDEKHPLRCFVGGKLVGDLSLSECARRNGVASGALDVGLDPSGALAADSGASGQITPLPPGAKVDSGGGAATGTVGEPAADIAITARESACWRYGEGEWSRLPDDLALTDCVQTLYAGLCDADGPPAYGRWADRTLRLAQGRVEISPNNRDFRILMPRAPGCAPGGPPAKAPAG